MLDDEGAPLDEAFLAYLAEYDEALAASGLQALAPEPPAATPFRERLRRAQICLQLLERDRRERSPALLPNPGESVLPPGLVFDPATGTGQLGRFQLLRMLGAGGFGIVYLAQDPLLGRLVALKVPRPETLLTPELRQRFLREARAAARLNHPHIVPVFDTGGIGPVCYIVSAYIPGGTLAQWLSAQTTAVPVRGAARLIATLADAVQHAHAQGILHRDLKPSNILLEAATNTPTNPAHNLGFIPRLTDFGLARLQDQELAEDGIPRENPATALSGKEEETASGAMLGTPKYMAPEQANGRRADLGPHTDVYALGAILYEMLTGRPPFKGATVLETLEQVRLREPVPVRWLQPKVPRDLETVCLKCLDKDPRKRYASAKALAQDLECWLNGEPIQARRSRACERGYRWIRRNPVVAALSGLVLLTFLGGFAGVAWQWRQTQVALDRAETNLYFQRISLADHEAQVGNTDRGEMLLELCPPALRHWEWHYLKRRCYADWLRLAGHTDLVRCVAYSADSTRLASSSNDRTVRVWDTTTGRELLTLCGHAAWVNTVVFHSDGQRLVSASEDGTVKVWDAADGRELRSLDHRYGFAFVTLSPDGQFFGVLQGEGLTVHDLETGQSATTIPGRIPARWGVAFSPDGRRVASVLNACLRIWDVRTGQEVHLLHKSMLGVYSLAFSPDGRRLFVSQFEGRYPTLKVWDATTGEEVPQSLNTPLTVIAFALSPDGQSILTGGNEGAVKVRDTTTGKDMHAMRTFTDPVVSLAFRPDGQGLAAAAGRDVWLRAWSGQKDQGPTTIRGHAGEVASVAFSPDGSRLASCGESDQVKVWDARTGQPVLGLTAPARGYSVMAFSPDGHRLLAIGRDGTVYSWDMASSQATPPLQVPNSELTDVTFSPDNRHLATAGRDRAVRVWDAATGQEVLTCGGHEAGVLGVRFSPDGRRLASAGSDATVRLWDATTGQEVLTLRGHESYVQSVAFHPGGRLLASASTDETVRLWDVAVGREVAKLKGHTGPVRGLSFSPDGRRLASAGEDGTVRLWDVATGQEALSLLDPGKVRGVAFSPDGWRLATASSDGTVKLWDATPLKNP
jgi:WD40 repeat protein